MGWGMGFFGWIWFILILAVVVLLIWALIKYIFSGDAPKRTPLDTLNERYARGEITREEYLEKKKDIGG